MSTEPARTVGRWIAGIVGGSIVLTTAFLQLLTAFGVPLDVIQQAAIIGFVTALAGVVGPLVGAEVIRNHVTPIDKPRIPVSTATVEYYDPAA